MEIFVNFQAMENAAIELETIKKKFLEEMENLKKIVSDTTINDWKGPDADKFVMTTNEKLSKVSQEYEEYLTQVRIQIDRNLQKFKDVQQRNINMMG